MKTLNYYILLAEILLIFYTIPVFANHAIDKQNILLEIDHSISTHPSEESAALFLNDSIREPWSNIYISGEKMKPFYPPLVVAGSPFPLFPVLAGVVGTGVITYVLVKPKEVEDDCTFNGMVQAQASTCGLANGTVILTVSPEATYTYQWSNGSTNKDLQNVKAGNYLVTITRVGTDCTYTLSTIIENNNAPINVTITSENAACGISNGTASINVSPAGTYTYEWSNGATTKDLTNLPAGSYTVTVTSEGDCFQTAATTIEENQPAFSVTVSSTPSACDIDDGTATVQVDPPGTYTFKWSNGATTQDLTDLPAGLYTVTVTSEGDCFQSATTTIEENPPAFSVTVSSTPSSCGVDDGTATVQVDPPGTYTLLWSNGEMGEMISSISPGSYSVTVTVPGSSCAVSGNVTVDERPPAFDISSETFPSDCGLSTGVVMLTVVPEGAYTFQWSNGGSSSEQNDLSAGTYQVTVTIEGSKCSKVISVTIEELPPTMMLTFNNTPAGCGVANGSANVIVSPAGSYDYVWSNGAMESSLTDVPSGEYMVTVSVAGSNCSVVGMVEVGQTGGGFTATFNTTNADCGLANGSAMMTIDPPGEYTYLWSNQHTEADLTEVEAGTYRVTVTDENFCTESFTVTVGGNPAEFVTITNTSPANCITSGEISFTLSTPGAGPLIVVVEGPLGTSTFSLNAGDHLLSSLMNVVGGTYTITVHDETTGEQCKDTGTAIVLDNTPDLEANEDFFMTSANEPVNGNVLMNDEGLNLQMTDVFNEFGGTVIFDSFGDFTFTPDPGFTGEASFFYTVTDACGETATALVTIFVEMVDCEFDVDFETTPASCGLEDGSATVEVLEPGEYEYAWSNGESGQTISDLEAGTYSVTIMDINLGCGLVFSVELEELPADYITDVVITQPTCGEVGEIQFMAFTTSQNPLVMSVTHPNGFDIFLINPGIIILSDYIPMASGDYIIEVTDGGAGPDCFESFEVTLMASEQIEIFVEAVFPPTEPTAMDGSAVIIISVPGTPPYSVLLNGLPIFETSDPVFTIDGLDIGEYTVQVIDAEGCMSNEVMFFVPFPPITQSFGTSVIYLTPHVSNEQPGYVSSDYMIRTAMLVSLEYYLRSVRQEWRLAFSPPVHAQGIFYRPYAELLCFTDLIKYKFKDVRWAFQGGLGSAFGSHPVALQESKAASPLWSLRASAAYAHKRTFKLQGSVSLQGWEEMQRPVVELSATFSLR